jgi:hypothetical protein
MSKSLAGEVSVYQKVKWNSESQLIPLTVGLIGHRKLPAQEIDGLVAEFDVFIEGLLGSLEHTPILLLTSLAEGADRIALRSRFRESLTICAVLPFDVEDYRGDFQGAESLQDFEESLNSVDECVEPFASDSKTTQRNLDYRKCANWISERSNILVAIWNGKFNDEPGGTSDTINFRAEKSELAGSIESLNKNIFHILGSNGDDVIDQDCNCPFHQSSQDGFLPDLYLIDSFNESISKETGKIDSSDISVNVFDSMASAAKRKFLYASRFILILGLVALNLLNVTQISNSRVWFFATLSTFLFTLYFWHRSVRLDLKAKYEGFRMIAEVLRIQSWWTQMGIGIRLIDHPHTKIDSDAGIRRIADNLISSNELQSLIRLSEIKEKKSFIEIHRNAKLWLTEQMDYLGGNSSKKGAIRANSNSAHKFELLSKIFIGVTIGLFVLSQTIQLREQDFSSYIFFMLYTMLIPISLSISAGSIAYIQLMGFKEISSRFESSFRVIERGLMQLEDINQSIDIEKIFDIVEEVGVESYCESIYWYKINKSKELRPL